MSVGEGCVRKTDYLSQRPSKKRSRRCYVYTSIMRLRPVQSHISFECCCVSHVWTLGFAVSVSGKGLDPNICNAHTSQPQGSRRKHTNRKKNEVDIREWQRTPQNTREDRVCKIEQWKNRWPETRTGCFYYIKTSLPPGRQSCCVWFCDKTSFSPATHDTRESERTPGLETVAETMIFGKSFLHVSVWLS